MKVLFSPAVGRVYNMRRY